MGLDVTRYQPNEAARTFAETGFTTLVDVGANQGQFAREFRALGFAGQIVSLEPGLEAFRELERYASRDPAWTCIRAAAGAESGEARLFVAANGGASSSILPMLDVHRSAAPDAQYVSSEVVPVVRLDELASRLGGQWGSVGLKLDVQGYERQVLEGCGTWFDHVCAVVVELSTVPLYEGAWSWREAADWLCDRGFVLAGLNPEFADPDSGRLLAFDGLFVRARR